MEERLEPYFERAGLGLDPFELTSLVEIFGGDLSISNDFRRNTKAC